MNMRFQLYSLACLLVSFLATATAQNACFQTSGDIAGFSLSVETVATDVLGGQTTYRVYLSTPSTDDFVSAVIGDATDPLFLNTTTDFYQHPIGGNMAQAVNPAFLEMPSLSDIVYDTWVTIGIDQAPDLGAGETDVSILVDPNIPSWEIDFASGGNLDISSSIGGGWYILPSSANGISGDDQKVLIAQATTDGDLSGQFFIQIFPNGDQSQLIENSFSFAASACGTPGCTDATACNYDDQATVDDGSCQQLDACGVCGGNGIPEVGRRLRRQPVGRMRSMRRQRNSGRRLRLQRKSARRMWCVRWKGNSRRRLRLQRQPARRPRRVWRTLCGGRRRRWHL